METACNIHQPQFLAMHKSAPAATNAKDRGRNSKQAKNSTNNANVKNKSEDTNNSTAIN